MFQDLINSLKERKEIDVIMLGGSRGRNTHDQDSDYDVYVYLNKEIPLEERKCVIDPYISYMEYGNHFWELEDDGVLKDGIEIEFIYRDRRFFDDLIQSTKNLSVRNGYSTCMLDNLLNSKVLYDRTGNVEEIKNTLRSLITDDLFNAVIAKNKPLLKDAIPALTNQIKKAVKRNDLHSINHRVTEYFSIYYDILFAVNKTLHMGEKRLYETALTFKKLPVDYKKDIPYILTHLYKDSHIGNHFVILSEKLLKLIEKGTR